MGEKKEKRKLRIGFGMLFLGILLVFLAGIIAVSETAGSFLLESPVYTTRLGIGGVLSGIGVPISFLGIFLVTPTSNKNKYLSYFGTVICFIGVGAFIYVYPNRWYGDPVDLTWLVFLIYTVGSVIFLFSLFRSVLDIRLPIPESPISIKYITKNDNSTGNQRKKTKQYKRNNSSKSSGFGGGGNDAEIIKNNTTRNKNPSSMGDIYCGNCDYYRLEDGKTPYCLYHKDFLNDLEPCENHEFSLKKAKNSDKL